MGDDNQTTGQWAEAFKVATDEVAKNFFKCPRDMQQAIVLQLALRVSAAELLIARLAKCELSQAHKNLEELANQIMADGT